MGENSKIEWTHHTFNPWIGCTKVSPGCTHCYAEAYAKRYGKAQWGPNADRVRTSEANWRKPLAWNRDAMEAGERRRVFCASLADVFEDRPELARWRGDLWNVIAETFRSARKMGWKFPRWRTASGSGSKWRTNDDGTMPCYCPQVPASKKQAYLTPEAPHE